MSSDSRGSDNEGGVEVPVNHQVSQHVVLSNFVLLCVDLLRQQLVKVNLLSRRSFCTHLLYVQVIL